MGTPELLDIKSRALKCFASQPQLDMDVFRKPGRSGVPAARTSPSGSRLPRTVDLCRAVRHRATTRVRRPDRRWPTRTSVGEWAGSGAPSDRVPGRVVCAPVLHRPGGCLLHGGLLVGEVFQPTNQVAFLAVGVAMRHSHLLLTRRCQLCSPRRALLFGRGGTRAATAPGCSTSR